MWTGWARALLAMTRNAVTSQRFKVTLPENASLGVHDVRILTKTGVSNPRAFVVGDLPDHCVAVGAPARVIRRHVEGEGWKPVP